MILDRWGTPRALKPRSKTSPSVHTRKYSVPFIYIYWIKQGELGWEEKKKQEASVRQLSTRTRMISPTDGEIFFFFFFGFFPYCSNPFRRESFSYSLAYRRAVYKLQELDDDRSQQEYIAVVGILPHFTHTHSICGDIFWLWIFLYTRTPQYLSICFAVHNMRGLIKFFWFYSLVMIMMILMLSVESRMTVSATILEGNIIEDV